MRILFYQKPQGDGWWSRQGFCPKFFTFGSWWISRPDTQSMVYSSRIPSYTCIWEFSGKHFFGKENVFVFLLENWVNCE